MPSLAPYFGWCVTGERADIHPHRKPAPQIFEAALARAGRDSSYTGGWVHVGDCLLNDVAASKGVGARTVWLDAAVEGDEDAHGAYSTMSDEQRSARQAQFDADRCSTRRHGGHSICAAPRHARAAAPDVGESRLVLGQLLLLLAQRAALGLSLIHI